MFRFNQDSLVDQLVAQVRQLLPLAAPGIRPKAQVRPVAANLLPAGIQKAEVSLTGVWANYRSYQQDGRWMRGRFIQVQVRGGSKVVDSILQRVWQAVGPDYDYPYGEGRGVLFGRFEVSPGVIEGYLRFVATSRP